MQPDATEDTVIDTARAAAVDFGIRILGGALDDTGAFVPTYPADTDQLPDSAHQAALQHAARLYKRRDSIDGTIAGGDLGIVQVGRTDPDVLNLYGVSRPVVFG
jgi:hypothetical protein